MGLRAAAALTRDNGDVADIQHDRDSQRFLLSVDGRRVGLLDYEVRGDAFVALHTEIDPSYGGRGLGGELVEQVLRHVRSTDLRLVPACSFVAHYVEQHPDDADLLTRSRDADAADADAAGAS